jgi:hypothetical protein
LVTGYKVRKIIKVSRDKQRAKALRKLFFSEAKHL